MEIRLKKHILVRFENDPEVKILFMLVRLYEKNNDPAVMEQVTGVLNDGGSCHLYTLEGAGFALASFAVMSLITAVIIVVTKKFWLLDFLLYGKQRRRNL